MNQHGFSLIELLMTLSIIAILATIANPSYSRYIDYARSLEARNALSKMAVALEHYHIEHGSYEGATIAAAPLVADYEFQLDVIDSEHYRISARSVKNGNSIISQVDDQHLVPH